jgi:hypothetical protein
MWRSMTSAWTPSRLSADMLALQGFAERAGCALACPFSSSEEFEAAVIRSRREAGAYGRRHHWHYALYAGAASAVLAATLWMI